MADVYDLVQKCYPGTPPESLTVAFVLKGLPAEIGKRHATLLPQSITEVERVLSADPDLGVNGYSTILKMEEPGHCSPVQSSDTGETPTSLIEDIKNLLECSICKERFDDPRMLPCQHSFCHNCLRNLELRNNLVCPICRKRYSPASLRSCLVLNNLLEISTKYSCLDVPRTATPPMPADRTGTSGGSHNYLSSDFDHHDDEYESDVYNFSDDDFSTDDYEYEHDFFHHDFSDIINYVEAAMNSARIRGTPDRLDHEERRDGRGRDATPSGLVDGLIAADVSSPRGHRPRNRGGRGGNSGTAAPPAAAAASSSAATQRRGAVRHRNSARTSTRTSRWGTSDKIFRRCADWPHCNLGDRCAYTHPHRRCRNPEPCQFGDTCCFLHPEDYALLRY
ncbi:unnamed protein product [Mesocestoides corti]|nr:unnamed protein product [Mesocestoides corti]